MSAASKEFTGRHMWLLAVSFFGVIISVNIVMAVSAARTWTGLVVENSYVASQEFQGRPTRSMPRMPPAGRSASPMRRGRSRWTRATPQAR